MLNDLERSSLRSPEETPDIEMVKGQLCHPLCSCEKCSKSLNQLKQNQQPNSVTVFSRDDQGVTGA